MSFSYGFFNAQNLDRVYTAEDFTAYLSSLICNGILDTYRQCFAPTVKNLSVTFGTGKAWIDGHYFISDTLHTIDLSSYVDESLNRYVAIGIYCDRSTRTCGIRVLAGTAATSPTIRTCDSLFDQGNTELCWAFGITSMGETSLIKQGIASTNVDFSEKHFGYFMYNRKNDILNNTKGDKTKVSGDWRYAGGNSLLAMLSLTGWYGLAKENIAPFNTGKWRLSDSVGQKDSAILKNGFFLGDTPQAAVVKSYIIGYGSVVMAYHAPEETWEETAYYGKNHEAYNCNSARQTANHIVAIVGWDDSYSRDNFNSGSRPSRDGAWIVKNSWGNQEGSNGYTYISYEDKSLCEFVAGQFVKASEYKYNYFYDGSANPGILKLKKGQKFANVFTAKKGSAKKKELIKAVNLVTWSANVKYSIQIYRNPKDGRPTSGTKMLKRPVTGTIREAGTHTIDLSRKAEVLRGDKFAVVVKLRSSGKIGFDENDDYHWVSFVNKTKKGQSYLYDHRKWNDLNPDHATVRLKAYTVMQPVNKIHLRYCKADSKNKNPKGIVLYYKGKHLKKNKDYKIVKKEGHKYVIVKGRGRYRGTKKIYLKTK